MDCDWIVNCNYDGLQINVNHYNCVIGHNRALIHLGEHNLDIQGNALTTRRFEPKTIYNQLQYDLQGTTINYKCLQWFTINYKMIYNGLQWFIFNYNDF